MALEEVNSDPGPHLELAESLILYAGQFPWNSYPVGDDAAEGTWRLWNVGFARAACALLRCMVLLVKSGLGREAQLQLRALMELVGNQYYMGEDKRRAIEFAARQAIEQQRLIQAGTKRNLIRERDASELNKRISEEREAIRQHLGDEEEEALERQGVYPFGRKASARLAAAGLVWHYELPYEMASSLQHMNARAVAVYLEDEPPKSGFGGGHLVLGNEMMLRFLYKADEALEQGQREVIDGFAIEYAKRVLPDKDRASVIAYLRGELRE